MILYNFLLFIKKELEIYVNDYFILIFIYQLTLVMINVISR